MGQLSLTESHSISSEATEFSLLRYSTLFYEHRMDSDRGFLFCPLCVITQSLPVLLEVETQCVPQVLVDGTQQSVWFLLAYLPFGFANTETLRSLPFFPVVRWCASPAHLRVAGIQWLEAGGALFPYNHTIDAMKLNFWNLGVRFEMGSGCASNLSVAASNSPECEIQGNASTLSSHCLLVCTYCIPNSNGTPKISRNLLHCKYRFRG